MLRKRLQNIPKLIYDNNLPIVSKRKEIIEKIRKNQVLIISGETGSGKTTQIPKFCLEAKRGIHGKIACTQPRRIAAINVAKRIAQEMKEEIGHSVGYKIRFQDVTNPHGFIKIMTDGILLAEAQSNRYLKEYDTIIVDEAHERSLNIDFILGIINRLLKKRKDLKLIITSATIDTEKFSKAFNNAPIIEVTGRTYPVEIIYDPPILDNELDLKSETEEANYVEHAVEIINKLHHKTSHGDILVFMPTEADINETCELLVGKNFPGVLILPLFARLSASEQTKVFSLYAGRKIIVATNVAETSITIVGIKYVVDTGLARISKYTPRTRTTSLPITPISQSSANQRMGRCGRIEDGICIRLYDKKSFESRPFFTSPEIIRTNLSEVILRMISLNLGTVESFPFIDKPSSRSIKDGYDNLLELGAIFKQSVKKKSKHQKQFKLTSKGKIMARLPVDPKLSRILIEAVNNNCLEEAIIIVSALSTADPKQRPVKKAQHADQQHSKFKDPSSDFITLLNIWQEFHKAKKLLKSIKKHRKYCKDNFLSYKKLREMQDIHFQIKETLKEHNIFQHSQNKLKLEEKPIKNQRFSPLYTAIHKSILSGYLSNIAMKKEKNFFNATKGRTVMLFPGSGLFNKADTWIVAAQMVETSQLFARITANIEQQWLEKLGGDFCSHTYTNPHWEKKRGEVVAIEQVTLFGLIIIADRKVSYGKINPVEASEIFIRNALVENDIKMKFSFIEHNSSLMDEISNMEDKMRVRDIMVCEEDLYLFYRNRLDNFYDIRTFAKFLKDKGNDKYLYMSYKDLSAYTPDSSELALYPDNITLGDKSFSCDYNFTPGDKKDGITINIPATDANSIPSESLDWLVPGLYTEKITALLKNLPKEYRKKLVPISDTAKIISIKMPKENRNIYTALSHFIYKQFNVNIPASVWSDNQIPDHLKMRISIKNSKGQEVYSSRNKAILKSHVKETDLSIIIKNAKKQFKIAGITTWDFQDIQETVNLSTLNIDNNLLKTDLIFYPALSISDDVISLCLFENKTKAKYSHKKGVKALYQNYFAKELKSIKKDMPFCNVDKKDYKQKTDYFGGVKAFEESIIKRLSQELFYKEIRTGSEFTAHAHNIVNKLYSTSQKIFKAAFSVLSTYHKARTIIYNLELEKGVLLETLQEIREMLDNIVPEKFIELYSIERVSHIERYVKALILRAQKSVVTPDKIRQKTILVQKMEQRLNNLIKKLTEDASDEKRDAVEDYFWMLEEYKVSIFAQELKTVVKVSEKRLEKFASDIDRML